MSRAKKKVSAASVIEIIFIVILVLIMAVMLSFNFLFRKGNAGVAVLGYSFYNTKAVNMLPDFPKDTVVIAKQSEIPNIKENSVILCNIGEHTTLIRVVQILQENDSTYYVVKFDTSPSNETFRIEQKDVIAKAIWQINGFGAFLGFATSTVGIIIAVIIPLIFIITIQVAKILSIRELEKEADSFDDIDDFVNSREENEPSPVTFTEPKFLEDITGKIPRPKAAAAEPEYEPEYERYEPEPRPEKVLSFDNRGKAEYVERPPQPAESQSAEQTEEKKNSPLFTYDRITAEKSGREPAYAGAGVSLQKELFANRPTKVEPEGGAVNEFLKKYAPEKSEPVSFAPHMSNVIPDSIAAVQEETSAVKKSGFDDSVKAYYEKSPEKTLPAGPAGESASIPEKAVRPKETIAPPRKQKNNKALEELMSIIDAEETKLKK